MTMNRVLAWFLVRGVIGPILDATRAPRQSSPPDPDERRQCWQGREAQKTPPLKLETISPMTPERRAIEEEITECQGGVRTSRVPHGGTSGECSAGASPCGWIVNPWRRCARSVRPHRGKDSTGGEWSARTEGYPARACSNDRGQISPLSYGVRSMTGKGPLRWKVLLFC